MSMKITCQRCGNAFEVQAVGTRSSFVCRKCGTLVPLVEEIAGKQTAVVSSGSTGTEDMLQPGERFRGYRIIKHIGSGAMGDIYKAKQISMDRIVALKILKKSLSEDRSFAKRFIREARSAGRLNHPNIIQIYDVGREDGTYFFSMEYVEGESLDTIIARKGVFDTREALAVVSSVAKALRKAEEKGIVHRDIKPANIIVSREGSVKVADFGLARPLDPEEPALTQTGVAIGTPYYMAPEQVHGSPDIDVRADIYALGCTFFHLITGRVPFRGKSTYEVLKGHESRPLEFPHDMNLPGNIRAVIVRMMAKSPDDRFSNVAEVIKALMEAGRSPDAPSAVTAAAKKKPKKKIPHLPWFQIIGTTAAVIGVIILLYVVFRDKGRIPAGNGDDAEQGGVPDNGEKEDSRPGRMVFTRADTPLFCLVTDIGKILSLASRMNKMSGLFSKAAVRGIIIHSAAARLNADPKVFNTCIENAGPVSVFSLNESIYTVIELPDTHIAMLFDRGFTSGSVSKYKGRSIYTGYPEFCLMAGTDMIIGAETKEKAYEMIEKAVLSGIRPFSKALSGSFKLTSPLALGYISGDIIRRSAKPGSVPDVELIEDAVVGIDRSGGRRFKGRIRVNFKDISGTAAGSLKPVPVSLFRESRLPAQGTGYVSAYIPDRETLNRLLNTPETGSSNGLADVMMFVKKEGVDFFTAGLYREKPGKGASFISEISVSKAGALLAGLKNKFSGEYFRPESEDRNSKRFRKRKINPFSQGVRLPRTRNGEQLTAVAVSDTRIYITNSKEGLFRLIRMQRLAKAPFHARRPGVFRWPSETLSEQAVFSFTAEDSRLAVILSKKGDSLITDITIVE